MRGNDDDQDGSPVDLVAGCDRVLAKVEDENGAWRFALRITGPGGRPLPGLELTADRGRP